jgi:peptide/nickel transport system permease protein
MPLKNIFAKARLLSTLHSPLSTVFLAPRHFLHSLNQNLLFGGALLAVFVLCAVLADFLSPYSPAAEHRESPSAPPSRIRFRDAAGHLGPRPFVYRIRSIDLLSRQYVEAADRPYPVRFFVTGEPYRLLGLFSCRLHLFGVDEPALIFLFGADSLGRDIFSRLCAGARLSLLTAAAALLISLPLALFIGGVAGYAGGALDGLSQRFIELLLVLPTLYLLIALRSALPLELPPGRVFFAMVGLMAVFGWAHLARIVRGTVLSLRQQPFVQAARALGASDRRILVRHIFPHLAGTLFPQAAIIAPGFILSEITLSYLGLGVSDPLPSLGKMLAMEGGLTQLTRFWWTLAPCVVIFFLSLTFYLLSEGLREYFHPHTPRMDVSNKL